MWGSSRLGCVARRHHLRALRSNRVDNFWALGTCWRNVDAGCTGTTDGYLVANGCDICMMLVWVRLLKRICTLNRFKLLTA
jgi:hypothetical protein